MRGEREDVFVVKDVCIQFNASFQVSDECCWDKSRSRKRQFSFPSLALFAKVTWNGYWWFFTINSCIHLLQYEWRRMNGCGRSKKRRDKYFSPNTENASLEALQIVDCKFVSQKIKCHMKCVHFVCILCATSSFLKVHIQVVSVWNKKMTP